MIISAVSLRIRISIAIIIFVLYILLFHGMSMNFINVTRSFNIRRSCSLRSNATRNISYENGWQLIGHTYEKNKFIFVEYLLLLLSGQKLLRKMYPRYHVYQSIIIYLY
jgi:hypothetical protein